MLLALLYRIVEECFVSYIFRNLWLRLLLTKESPLCPNGLKVRNDNPYAIPLLVIFVQPLTIASPMHDDGTQEEQKQTKRVHTSHSIATYYHYYGGIPESA